MDWQISEHSICKIYIGSKDFLIENHNFKAFYWNYSTTDFIKTWKLKNRDVCKFSSDKIEALYDYYLSQWTRKVKEIL